MIPKKIHLIWLGGKDKTKLSKMCIQSWHDKLSDYEIIEWNESNLDLDEICASNKFFEECRKRELWAFMADYLRLKILFENGGIYFDTDIQVVKRLDDLLDRATIIGYEKDYAGNLQIGTGVIGCEKGNPTIKECLEFYDQKIWEYPFFTIPRVMEFVLKDKNENILPVEYLTPFAFNESVSFDKLSEKSYTIHWFEGSWSDKIEIRKFLKTKHIKNPVKRKFCQMVEILKYYKHKLIKKTRI